MAIVDQVNTVLTQRAAAEAEQKGSERTLVAGGSQSGAAKGKAADMQSSYSVQAADGIQYDISKRTSQVAAWWKDMTQFEEEMVAEEEVLQEEEAMPWEKGKDTGDEAEEGIRSLERMLERLRERQKSASKNTNATKRRLTYNHRKVSSAIGGAKTLMQASNALASANSNLNSIRRKAASGKYDADEIAMAKNHAMKMVRTARKKVRNLKLEGNKRKQNTLTETRKRHENNVVATQSQHQKMEEELQRLKKELKRQEKRYKNMHRRKESWDLMQADMEYLRRKIDLMRRQEDRYDATDTLQQESVAAVPEAPNTVTVENEQTIETQQQAAMAVAEVSVSDAAASIDVTI